MLYKMVTCLFKKDKNRKSNDNYNTSSFSGNMHAVKCLVGNGANVDAPEESKNVPILSAIGQSKMISK